MNSKAHKLSISLPQSLFKFIENYKKKHNCKNRSEVINKAIHLLQKSQLETFYKEASKEVDQAFENTTMDGLDENETW